MSLLQTILLNLPILLASWSVARRLRAGRDRLDMALSAAVLAWSWITAGVILLGMSGLLSLPFAFGWSALAGLIGAATWRGGSTPPNPDGGRLGPLALIALGVVALTALPRMAESFVWPVKVVSDGPIYHLYFAVRWWKAGRLFLVPTPFGETAAPYFPANGDLWFTWLTVGWGGDRLARIGQVPYLVLAGMASAGISRRLGASASSAVLAATLFLSGNPLLLFTFEPNVDTIFVAGYLLSAYFLVRLWQGDLDRSTPVLAGLAAGLAWGTKPTGVVFVPLLLLFGGLAIWRGGGRILRSALLLLAATSLGIGFWYLRNALLTGNPLYPLQVTFLGRPVLTGWYGAAAMKTSPYYIPVGNWRALVDILFSVIDFRLVPLWCLALLGVYRKGTDRTTNRIAAALAVLAIANIAAYWLLLPYRTQQRFMLQAFGLLAPPLARFLDRSVFWRILALVALIVHLTTWQSAPDILDFSPAIPSDLAPLFLWSWIQTVAGGVAVAVFAPGLFAISGEKPWLRALGAIGVSAAVALCFLGAWWDQQASPFRPLATFPRFADYLPGWIALEGRTGASGARIAYAGTNLPYYLMGKGLRNEVRYVNIDPHPGWLLHDYHRQAILAGEPNWPGTRPGWDRIHPDYDAWVANLEAAGIQLLVTARANPAEGPFNVADRAWFPIERVWADAHPERFTPLYGDSPPDPKFRIYRFHPAVEKKSSRNRTD